MAAADYLVADEQAAIQHFVYREPWPEPLRRRYIDSIKNRFAEISQACQPGDSVWICRSRIIGPMAGHEGLGIVRDGQIVRYDVIVDY